MSLAFVAAFVSCDVVQVSPPSLERAKTSGTGSPLPRPFERNETEQTYTWPKYRELDALSAHTCSLSENVVLDCLVTTTGGFHAEASPAAARPGSSVRETATASKPLNAGVVERLDASAA